MLIAADLPADRRQALVRGASLPERMNDAALFADISGFTRLTEGLVQALGTRVISPIALKMVMVVKTAIPGNCNR
jgi:hypothetical protein